LSSSLIQLLCSRASLTFYFTLNERVELKCWFHRGNKIKSSSPAASQRTLGFIPFSTGNHIVNCVWKFTFLRKHFHFVWEYSFCANISVSLIIIMPWRTSLRDLRVQVIQESRRFTLRSGNVLSSQWNKVRRFVQESKSTSTQNHSNHGAVNGDQINKGWVLF
jgi:hypothetical protein